MCKKFSILSLVFAAVLLLNACSSGPKIEKGNVVKVNYTGFLKDGKVFDTTEGKQPFEFMVGTNQVLPAFEAKLIGLAQGAKKKFTLSAKDAYGTRDEAKVATLPRDKRFPQSLNLEEGGVLFANKKAENGQQVQVPVKVVKVTDKEVTLDYNHPLAGEDLTYEVTVVEIVANEAPEAPAAAEKAPEAAAAH